MAETLLDVLDRESLARCEERWLALRVPSELASEFAADERVGESEVPLLAGGNKRLQVLVAPMGSGKSLMAERAYRRALRRRASEGAGAPIPVFVRLRGLSEPVETRIREAGSAIGDVDRDGVAVVLDAADERGAGAAAEALQTARILVRSHPNWRVVLTSRPLPTFDEIEETVYTRDLDPEQARSLVGRVAGREVTLGETYGWPAGLRQAVTTPLFAILFGNHLRMKLPSLPVSRGDLLRDLVRRALESEANAAGPVLREIAVRSLLSNWKDVRIGDLGASGKIDQAIATRLVTVRADSVTFPLVAIAQWFCAERLLEGETLITALTNKPADLELWRYPLAMAVGAAGEQRASELLAPLAEQHAGFASQIVEDAIARWAVEPTTVLDSPVTAGRLVRDTTRSWAIGCGPLASLIVPGGSSDDLPPIAVHAKGDWLTCGWAVERTVSCSGDEVVDLPGHLLDLWRGAPVDEECDGVRAARPGSKPAWAWRWSLEGLRDDLRNMLKHRDLPLLDTPLRDARLWGTARTVLGFGITRRAPVPIKKLLKRLPSDADALITPNGVIPVQQTREVLADLLERGITEIDPPFTPPDQNFAGGWTWSGWSHQARITRTCEVYAAALQSYETLTSDGPFAALAPWMQTAATLPGMLKGMIAPSDPNGIYGSDPPEVLIYWFEALPHERLSVVDIRRDTRPRDIQDAWTYRQASEAVDRTRALRPRQARWISTTMSSTLLNNVFEENSAEEILLDWLWKDLQSIRWVPDGRLPAMPFDALGL